MPPRLPVIAYRGNFADLWVASHPASSGATGAQGATGAVWTHGPDRCVWSDGFNRSDGR